MIELEPGWSAVKAKRVLREVDVRGHPDEVLLAATQAGGVVPRSHLDYRVWNPTKDLHNYKLVEPGQFVISLRSFQGGIEHSANRGIVSPAYTVMSLDGDCEPGYFRHLLKSSLVVTQLDVLGSGIRQGKSISYESFGDIELGLPPAAVQRSIADFLDRETERIDRLMERKRRLIELLEEKRTALISQAVTKGLDRTVPMKDSGVPWLGEIPAHWRRYRVSHVFEVGSGTTPKSDSPEYYDGSTPWVLTGDLDDGPVQRTQKTVTAKALADYSALKLYPASTLVIAMYGATIGKLGWLTQTAAVNQACCALQPRGPVRSQFAFYWLLANRPHIVSMGVGGGQPNISQEIVRSLKMPVPRLDQQDEITHYLDARRETLSRAGTKIGQQLDKLAEYRQALITAAVTGQIDIAAEQKDPEEVVA